jgi:hypothetical protein
MTEMLFIGSHPESKMVERSFTEDEDGDEIT